ncbi:hypothetical protein QWY97_10495 [Vibrio cortegadensis]|nr:hypothetical protein [Vibrio cortegadensis]MDN3697774.1 hypothetical protein [Vibrio cortegadensis]
MKLNKSTLIPLGTTVLLTVGILALINNVSALGAVKDTINGDKGWF